MLVCMYAWIDGLIDMSFFLLLFCLWRIFIDVDTGGWMRGEKGEGMGGLVIDS